MIIACDIGLKRIGIAGLIEGIILPMEPILRTNRNQAASDLSKLLKEKNAHTLIVGIPQSGNAEDTKRRIMFFVSLLETSAKIFYVNEDCTSLEARQDLSHLKKQRRQNAQKNGRIDSLAACKILQRYLQKNP